MVLESLVTPRIAEKKPWEMFFIGFLFTTIAVFISLQIFDTMAGLISVFLTVLALVPLMYATIKLEEQKDMEEAREWVLLKEHSRAIMFFMAMFMGVVISYTMWFVFLPLDLVQQLFTIQIDTIRSINSLVIANVSRPGVFSKLFFNNIKVLTFCILFAFFYGAGAVFILTWNASVIAVAMGTFIRNKMGIYAGAIGLPKVGAYFHVFSLGILRYMIHGVPEILAYFVGGLAGGIISVAVIRHDFRTKKFERIILDSSDLILISIALLFVAALIETYVTPFFF